MKHSSAANTDAGICKCKTNVYEKKILLKYFLQKRACSGVQGKKVEWKQCTTGAEHSGVWQHQPLTASRLAGAAEVAERP